MPPLLNQKNGLGGSVLELGAGARARRSRKGSQAVRMWTTHSNAKDRDRPVACKNCKTEVAELGARKPIAAALPR